MVCTEYHNLHLTLTVPEKYQAEEKQKRFEELDLNEIKKEYQRLKAEIIQLKSPVLFTHNDLLGPNIILSTDKSLYFVLIVQKISISSTTSTLRTVIATTTSRTIFVNTQV